MSEPFSQKDIQELLKTASQKLNTNPEQLKKAAEGQKLDSVLKNIDPKDAEKVKKILADKDATQKLLSTPQAQALLNKFMKNK